MNNDIKYSYEEFDDSQESQLKIDLVYTELGDNTLEKKIVFQKNDDVTSEWLSLNTIFAFQTQFKELKNEIGKVKIQIRKGNEVINLGSNQQLKPYFKEMINEIKTKGNKS